MVSFVNGLTVHCLHGGNTTVKLHFEELIIIIIMTAFKGTIRDFFLQSPHCAANYLCNTCAPVAKVQSCANQVQHI